MAAPQASADRSPLSAQVVGYAFVQQYYLILQQSPELVYRFYQESSKLGRPDAHGAMTSVTTTEAINQKILSMGFLTAELKTVDAQESLGSGVIVLVTGHLVREDNVKKDFTQSFFLAPQDNGYYVMNDIFRFVEETDHQQGHQSLSNGTSAPHAPAPEHDLAPEQQRDAEEQTVPSPVEDEEVNEEEVYNPSDKGEVLEEEEPIGVVNDEVPNNSESNVVAAQDEMPKKSYASILKVMKDSTPVSVPTRAPPKPTSIEVEPQSVPAPATAPASDISISSSTAAESNNAQEADADGYSIYVKSLPLDATPAQLEEEFKKFGPIKPGGIQVRSHKLQGFCFGFVEFEVPNAVQSAIQASPIMIGGRPAYVEEKRATGSRVNRGRYPTGRGAGFRNDGRGRANYGGGRGGYGRGDFNPRADFGSRGGGRAGSSNRTIDMGYQRVDHAGAGGGRGNRAVASAN